MICESTVRALDEDMRPFAHAFTPKGKVPAHLNAAAKGFLRSGSEFRIGFSGNVSVGRKRVRAPKRATTPRRTWTRTATTVAEFRVGGGTTNHAPIGSDAKAKWSRGRRSPACGQSTLRMTERSSHAAPRYWPKTRPESALPYVNQDVGSPLPQTLTSPIPGRKERT